MNSVDDLRIMFVTFGLGYAGLSGVIVMLNQHALSIKMQLRLNQLETFDTETEKQGWIINVAVAATSILLAVTLPDNPVTLAGPVYALFGIVLPWHSTSIKRNALNKSNLNPLLNAHRL